MDRRNKSRIDVQLTCSVNAGRAEVMPIRTLTENVSRSGMLMVWGSSAPLPGLNKKLTLDVQLPENSEFGRRVMRCRAEVTRIVAREAGDHHVALRVLSMRFINPGADEISSYKKGGRKVRDLASMPVATSRVI
jgi:c-di-GMP-binding flagellar brake protein YcgR